MKKIPLLISLLLCSGCYVSGEEISSWPNMPQCIGAAGVLFMILGASWRNWKTNPIGFFITIFGMCLFLLA